MKENDVTSGIQTKAFIVIQKTEIISMIVSK